MQAEAASKTVTEMFPDSEIARIFDDLAHDITEGKRYTARFLSEHELEETVLGRGRPSAVPVRHADIDTAVRREPYVARRAHYGEPLGGCAFSGAVSAATSVGGMVTILHSPLSCAHYAMQLQGMCALRREVPGGSPIPGYLDPGVVCTAMGADDMVFGGSDLLVKAVDGAVRRGARSISVVTSCPSGIIGDDAADACAAARIRHPDVDIILMEEDGNAKGDFMQGVVDGCITLIRCLAVPGRKKPDSVNIIGVKTLASGTPQEISSVIGMLSDLGISVNCVFPASETVDGIRHIADAEANLMINGDAFSRNLARFLSDEYGMECLPVPVRGGLEGTRAWVECVAGRFGKQDRAERLLLRIRERFDSALVPAAGALSGRRFVIMSTTRDIGWAMEALEGVGAAVEKIFVYRRPDHSSELDADIPDDNPDIVYYSDGARVLDEINSLHPDVLLASYPITGLLPDIRQAPISVSAKSDPLDGVNLVH